MSSCAQKSGGFLGFFGSACGEPAVSACMRCGKPICLQHQQPVDGGISCPDCMTLGSSIIPDPYPHHIHNQHHHQHTGSDSNYSSADYNTFEGQGGEVDGGGASGDFQDS